MNDQESYWNLHTGLYLANAKTKNVIAKTVQVHQIDYGGQKHVIAHLMFSLNTIRRGEELYLCLLLVSNHN